MSSTDSPTNDAPTTAEAARREVPSLGSLFLTIFKVGVVTFGGGFAMMPLIEREACESHNWMERKEILDLFAVSQSIPGAVAMNTVIFIGMELRGVAGATVALMGMVLPSFIIILAVASMLYRFVDLPVVANAFGGIRAAVVALIVFAAFRILEGGKKGLWVIAGSIVAFAAVVAGIHPALVILAGGVLGAAFQLIRTLGSSRRRKGGSR